MKRFASLHPESGMAHYLYAVALAKQGGERQNSAAVESQLQTAVQLDPHLGDAYLQLGIFRSRRQDFPGAIAAFQKAIENTPLPDQAHYRLAEVYRQMGDTEMATTETALFKQISEQKKTEADRERHEIQQFVYTLRDRPAAPKTTPPKPH
jgi:cytochrome c-type biogenesis protein CcmH/NrfG